MAVASFGIGKPYTGPQGGWKDRQRRAGPLISPSCGQPNRKPASDSADAALRSSHRGGRRGVLLAAGRHASIQDGRDGRLSLSAAHRTPRARDKRMAASRASWACFPASRWARPPFSRAPRTSPTLPPCATAKSSPCPATPFARGRDRSGAHRRTGQADRRPGAAGAVDVSLGEPAVFGFVGVEAAIEVRPLVDRIARADEQLGYSVTVVGSEALGSPTAWFSNIEHMNDFVLYAAEADEPYWKGQAGRQADRLFRIASGDGPPPAEPDFAPAPPCKPRDWRTSFSFSRRTAPRLAARPHGRWRSCQTGSFKCGNPTPATSSAWPG